MIGRCHPVEENSKAVLHAQRVERTFGTARVAADDTALAGHEAGAFPHFNLCDVFVRSGIKPAHHIDVLLVHAVDTLARAVEAEIHALVGLHRVLGARLALLSPIERVLHEHTPIADYAIAIGRSWLIATRAG